MFLLKINKLLIFPFLFAISFNTNAQSIHKTDSCDNLNKELWIELSDSGKYQEAIKELFKELQNETQVNKHAIYWHIGQLYAFDEDYKNAIIYMKKSSNPITRIFDRVWRLYYKGTISFLKKDKKKLEKYYIKLWRNHSYYYRQNACKLKALYENFDKTYKNAYEYDC